MKKLTEVQIKELQILAHKFTENMVPVVTVPVTELVLEYAIKIIDERREKIKDDLEPALETDSDEVKARKEAALKDFSSFQAQWLGMSTNNIRYVVLNIVGALTSDYFPGLAEAQQEKEKEEAEREAVASNNGEVRSEESPGVQIGIPLGPQSEEAFGMR